MTTMTKKPLWRVILNWIGRVLRNIWESELLSFLRIVMAALLVVLLIVGLVAIPANALARLDCQNRYTQIGYPTRYINFSGCQLEVEPGRWVPLSNYQWVDGNAQETE